MESFLLLSHRDQVETLRRTIARTRELFEVCRENGEADWQQVNPDFPFDWDPPLSLTGAKRFFFPTRERLLKWEGEAISETVIVPPPFALFGLRSCDLTAIAYQDKFFSTHPWYVRRREQALLIGVNCLRACPGGFCLDVDAGPFARVGFDLNLTLLPDDRVAVQIGSDLGRDLITTAGLHRQDMDSTAISMFGQALKSAKKSFPERPFLSHAIRRINTPAPAPGALTSAEWQALGPSCLACTGCTSLCPTCSCFTVVDEVRDDGGERVRYWDSCLLEGFQREGSGHHPAPHPGDRVSRFWYHKFSDDFASDFGRYGCVGCGRCDVTCPGSIGALHVLRRLGEGAS